MAEVWVTEEFDQTGEFWLLEALRNMLVDKGIVPKESFMKGLKIEWNLGSSLEVKYLVEEE